MEWGIRAHFYAKTFLTWDEDSIEEAKKYYLDSNPVDKQVIDEAYEYSLYVRSLLTPGCSKAYETRVDLSDLYPGMQGTPDALILDNEKRHLHVVDLKTGREWVSANNNSQLMLYAHGALLLSENQVETITLHIYQNNERSGQNINTHTFTTSYLNNFITNVKNILQLYNKGIYSFTTGEQCKYCPVQQHCVVYTTKATEGLYNLGKRQHTLESLTIEELCHMYTLYKELTPFIDSIQARLLTLPSEKLTHTNIEIKSRKSPQRWRESSQILETVLQKLRVEGAPEDAVAPRTLLTPAKLKKLSELYYNAVTEYIESPPDSKYLSIKKR